jgi:hypothetical protein
MNFRLLGLQMSMPIHRKINIGLALVCVVSFILIPDVIIGLLLEAVHFLFDSLFQLVHIALEMIELTLDKVVKYLFDTDMQTTQVIVFYLMLIPGIYLGYHFMGWSFSLCRRCSQNLLNVYEETKNSTVAYWHSLTVISKVTWIAISVLSLYLLSLVSF